MTHTCEAAMARNLAALRAVPRPASVTSGTPVAEQVYVNWDGEEADVKVRLEGAPDMLAVFDAEVSGTPRWFSISVALGRATLSAGDVLGLVVAARAARPLSILPYLRTRTGTGMRDTHMDETIDIGVDRSVTVRLATIGKGVASLGPDLPQELILPMPRESFRLELMEMRLFVLPADPSVETILPELGSFAV